MEAVHRPYNRSWIDDTIINIKRFSEEWTNSLPFEICGQKNETFLQNIVSEEKYAELEKQCGLEAMKCKYQERVELCSSINVPSNMGLDTLKFQEEDLKKRSESSKYACMVYNSQKFSNFPPHQILGPFTGIDIIPFKPIDTPEVVLSVQIYVPERRTESKCSFTYAKVPAFQVDQEFLVLGSQYLTELRDRIECVSDKAIPGEFSECPLLEPNVTCKDLYKSGFFCINGTFYNDMRDQDCRDYSDIIIKWAEKESRGIGPFRKSIMEKTRFLDLSIQLGYPYVYIHQGECEHLVVFSELRMYTKHEVSNKNTYPLFVSVKPSKRIFCMVCHAYTCSWVVFDNRRLPENPFFFCKHCFFGFNYDQDNQKIGSFRAYHFPDRSKLT